MASDSVSVIVPVHNGAEFVDECWQTLRAQTLPPSEVLFVDDGSTDGTYGCLRVLDAREIAVRVLRQPCAGPAAARNAGLAEARGDFVAFLDIDDLWPERKLERALAAFRERPELGVVGGLVELEWLDGGAAGDPALRTPHRRVNLGAFVFRTALFALHGTLDVTLRCGEDVEYVSRLRQAGVPFLELDEVALRYRRHAGNMTRGRDPKELGLFEALSRSLMRNRSPRARDEEPKT